MSTRDLHHRLESVFTQIQQQRMADVPVLNPRLQTRALGFRPWQDYQLGILITPWFMNLMLIPAPHLPAPGIGTRCQHSLPAGDYEFISGFEPGIGHYQSCSLFSPMFEFADQQAAELTAREALRILMCEDTSYTSTAQAHSPTSRRDFLRGKLFGSRSHP